jgi:hypothetical protein
MSKSVEVSSADFFQGFSPVRSVGVKGYIDNGQRRWYSIGDMYEREER